MFYLATVTVIYSLISSICFCGRLLESSRHPCDTMSAPLPFLLKKKKSRRNAAFKLTNGLPQFVLLVVRLLWRSRVPRIALATKQREKSHVCDEYARGTWACKSDEGKACVSSVTRQHGAWPAMPSDT